MSPILRLELLLFSVFFLIFVVRSINKKKLWLQHSLIWVFISFALIAISIFPQIIIWGSNFVQIETPSNFVYLLGIITLLIITFLHSIIISKQSNTIKSLVQIISISNYLADNQKNIDIKDNFND